MAKTVLTDAYLSISGTDVSGSVLSISVPWSVDAKDQTTMGATQRTYLPGLKDMSIDVEFAQDWAASALDSILFPNLGTAVAIEVRTNKTASVGTGNPKWTGSAFISSYDPVNGAVGELAKSRVKLMPTTVFLRATA